MDVKEGELGLSEVELGERAELRSQIQNLLSLEEVLWRQKLRMLCIKKDDDNTKFFHEVANSRRRYNHISMLEVNGIILRRNPRRQTKLYSSIKTCTRSLRSGGLLWKVWSLIR